MVLNIERTVIQTPNTTKQLVIDYTTSEVEHFLIANKPYQQLSDHFGLTVSLDYI